MSVKEQHDIQHILISSDVITKNNDSRTSFPACKSLFAKTMPRGEPKLKKLVTVNCSLQQRSTLATPKENNTIYRYCLYNLSNEFTFNLVMVSMNRQSV